jgi:hypothetical protein
LIKAHEIISTYAWPLALVDEATVVQEFLMKAIY